MRKYYKNDIIRLSKDYNPENEYMVYFLIFNEEIVYVGKSLKVYTRIETHKLDKHFNKVFYLNQPNEKTALEQESYYIKKFNPLYNKYATTHELTYLERTNVFCEDNNLSKKVKNATKKRNSINPKELFASLLERYSSGQEFAMNGALKVLIASETGCNPRSFDNAFTFLVRENIIVRLNTQLYKINPRHIFKGSSDKRNSQLKAVLELHCKDC